MSEQFENSIRKKLEEADIPFDPAAWDNMKKRLDESDRRRPVFWWWTSGFLLLLLLAGGGWWWYAQQQPSTVLQKNIPTITEADKATPISKKINTPTGNVDKSNTNTSEKINDSGKATSSEKTITTPIAKHQTSSEGTTNETTSNETTATNNPNAPQESIPARYDIQPIPFNQRLNKFIPAYVNNSPVINTRTDTTANNYTKKEKIKRSGFDGGITLGPDYNIAPSFQRGKLGFNGGIFLRYHVNNRLSLSVAAVYAKKIYGATPKDYKFDYPVNYVKIDADCNVIDVPLNVNYTFRETPKSTWSAMAGASSYFMLKEKYDYYWANNTKRTREFSNQNQHYFSVLNLGVTYERKTSGRLKWGLQPYVKVPLNGVGEGKVKLSSAGVSLQLSLGKKD